VVLGKNALGPERRGDRYGEALGKASQTVGGAAMLDAGAGEDRNPLHRRCAILAEERAAGARRHRGIDRMRVEQCLIDRLMSDMKLARQHVVRQRQVNRACRRARHLHECAAKQVIEVQNRIDGGREAGDGCREHRIIQRLGTGVLELAQSLHCNGNLAAHDEHFR
jgi:hypothetical protein